MDRTPAPQRDAALVLLRVAALIGLAIAGYLLYLALTGQTAPGCGEGASGCNAVLSSKFAKVFNLPVSVFAVGAYVVILAASLHAGPRCPRPHQDGAWRIIGVVAIAAAATALWFIALQWFVLKGFCVYCMAAHGCSLIAAGIVWVRDTSRIKWIGLLPAVFMAAAQLLATPSPPGLVEQGTLFRNLDPASAPTIGDPDAPYVIALLFDYNCAYCRDVHAAVLASAERYGDQLVVVMLPTAIDPACNPGAASRGSLSATSCEFTKAALAVWAADPPQFPGYDRWLLGHAERRAGLEPSDAVAEAYGEARRRIGVEAFNSALNSPAVADRLTIAGGVYEHALAPPIDGRRGVPRLIIAERAYPGIAEPHQLAELLEAAYPGLAPANPGDR